jgi:predicted negative regulator of RcsB-dependent stress response
MKRTERRHLKDNELRIFARQARETFEERRRETMAIIVIVAVIAVAAIGYYAWRERVQAKAHTLLAEALTVRDARVGPPPAAGTPSTGGLSFATERERAQAALAKFKVVADKYPSTDAGLYARYQEAATYMSLENPTQAATTYQQVVDRAGSSIYGQMARLGVAEAQARAGQYDQAINTFKELSLRKDGPLPVDGILMQLGRTYLVAGKRADAQQTFNRLVEEFPESPYTSDARRELENLRKT